MNSFVPLAIALFLSLSLFLSLCVRLVIVRVIELYFRF